MARPRKPRTPSRWHREVGAAFAKDLPSLIGFWVALCVIAVVVTFATGYEDWPAALWFGVGLVPVGVAMIPVFWMSPGWSGFGLFSGLRQLWLILAVVGWMFVALLMAIGIASVIWRLGGVEHV